MVHRWALSLRFRFLALLGSVLVCAMLALGALSHWLIFPALQAEERAAAHRELDRTARGLVLSQQQLHAQVRDWAHWDDTYRFLQGDYPGFTEVNFSAQMFEDMRYQLMALFTLDGELYFLSGIDPQTGQFSTCTSATDECAWMAPWSHTMQQAIESGHANETHIAIEEWPALLAGSPILQTDESGPAVGWLFKLRALNDAWQALMADYTGLSIALSVTDATHPPEAQLTFSDDTAYAEQYFPTLGSASQLALGIELNRHRYLSSLTTFNYVLIWTAVLMSLVIGLVLLVLERLVLKPLRQLTHFTQQLAPAEAATLTLAERRDEIGTLSRAFHQQLACQRQLNTELIKLSTHDPLTGLPNRRLFDQRLEAAITDAQQHPVAVMMLDIDHFKLYNDHYGHVQGDKCLQQVAQVLERCAAARGYLIARTGGEEFSALLLATEPSQALQLARHIIAAIDQLALPHATSPVCHHVTISVGVGSLQDSQTAQPSAVMSTADQALYMAKAQGRHRAVRFASPLASDASSTHNTPP